MTPWVGAEAELFTEAMRIVPALAKHEASDRRTDVVATLTAYSQTAQELGVFPVIAWAVLASAHMAWVQNLFELYAEQRDISIDDAIDEGIVRAASWAHGR